MGQYSPSIHPLNHGHHIPNDKKDIDRAEKKRAVLLTVCGPATYQLLKSLIQLAKPLEKSYTHAVSRNSDWTLQS